jgi:hypothetical protein
MDLLTLLIFGVLGCVALYTLYLVGAQLLKIIMAIPMILGELAGQAIEATQTAAVAAGTAVWNAPGIKETRLILMFLIREIVPFPLQRIFGNPRAGIGDWKSRGVFD